MSTIAATCATSIDVLLILDVMRDELFHLARRRSICSIDWATRRVNREGRFDIEFRLKVENFQTAVDNTNITDYIIPHNPTHSQVLTREWVAPYNILTERMESEDNFKSKKGRSHILTSAVYISCRWDHRNHSQTSIRWALTTATTGSKRRRMAKPWEIYL